MKTTISIDTKALDKAFTEYRNYSRRGLAEDINQKAYSICIASVALTKRAKKSEIRRYLKSPSRINPDAPIAAILVNFRRGLKGLKGLRGQAMKDAVEEFIRKQADSINFLRAGWLSAVAVLAEAIRKAPGANAIRFLSRFGKHGGGTPAKPGTSPTAYFWNQAFTRHTSTENGIKYAQEGLAKAVAQEITRMGYYIALKQEQRAKAAFQKFLRF